MNAEINNSYKNQELRREYVSYPGVKTKSRIDIPQVRENDKLLEGSLKLQEEQTLRINRILCCILGLRVKTRDPK